MSEILAFCETCRKNTVCDDWVESGDFYCEQCDFFVPTDGTEKEFKP